MFDFLKFFKYPVKVVIFEKRAGGFRIRIDKAMRIRKPTGEEHYKLHKSQDQLIPPEYTYISPNNWIVLYSPTAGAYAPIEFTFLQDIIDITTMPENRKIEINNTLKTVKEWIKDGVTKIELPTLSMGAVPAPIKKWMTMNLKDAVRKWQNPSFINKIAPWLGLTILCVGIGLSIYLAYEKIIQIQQIGNSMLPQLQGILDTMSKTCYRIPSPGAPPVG